MSYDQAVALLREFGFPVFVACWFMWRLEKRLDRSNELLSKLMEGIALLAKSIDYRFVEIKNGNGNEESPKEDQP